MIERLYPGVFVTEVAFDAKPIDGVSTSTAAFRAATSAALPDPPPQWPDHNQHDPGVTPPELLSWVAEELLYRAGPVGDAVRRAHAPWGVVDGLAIEASGAGPAPAVSVSPGVAVGPEGGSIDADAALRVHRDPEPWP